MEYLLYRGHDLTVSISEKVQEELVKFMPRFEHKYRVVHNGVDLARFPLVAKSGSLLRRNQPSISVWSGDFMNIKIMRR